MSVLRIFVCDKDVMRPDDIITCGSPVQEAMCGYRNIVDSKRWEPTYSKKSSKDKTLLLKDSTVAI